MDLTNPQSLNRYAYVGNRPMIRTDRSGLFYVDCVWYGNCSGLAGPGGGGGYYGGGSGGCSLDGVQTACANLTGLGSNAIAPCPNNVCSGFSNGVFIQYQADANANGFYSCLTTGSFSTQKEAGIAAVNCANGPSTYYNREYSGNIYQTNGKYSFTVAQAWGADQSNFDPLAIPDGTAFAGDYHTHGAFDVQYLNEQFSEPGCNDQEPCDIGLALLFNHGQPMYLGTPQGRTEVFYPALVGTYPLGCVLVGSAVPVGPGISAHPVPKCPH